MKDALKIVIPIHSLDPGGVERVALGLAGHWQRAGHQVTIVLGRPGCDRLASAPPLDYWQIPSRLSTASWETPWMVYCLYSYLIEHRADVLFLPGNTYAVVGAAMKLLLGDHGPPMALKVSNTFHRPDMPALLRQGYGIWLRAQGRLFERLVGLSEPMAREIRQATGATSSRIDVIANPILPRSRLRALGKLDRRAPSIWGTRYLTAGRLVPQKNHAMLLRAFARAARPSDTLTIAGEGPGRSALEQLAAESGIADRVRLAGHVASIDPLLEQADAFVLSSDYEGLPGVVVEALAAGLPVLSTDCCASMRCLVEDGRTGLLVPRDDEAAFAEGLARIREFRGDAQHARTIAARYEVADAADRYIDMMMTLRRERESRRRHDRELSTWARHAPWRRSL
ncbi:MAG: glycosyl transferase family 1 [Novosphingobium lindaniclasticum]|jgi:glycosyltransferase involved in cell wall biosynthesis|uniref:glycosyltransferase n=1 Tax=Novosphingobium lindaniclasticum TaxID=1329895 RepID=UPI00240A9B20|nr:glycosyltransferase [Novosphingobium lindaniclasticum]MDF2640049.1 glycosyl transferase family 1 [Novosphingobium lindaniclasticum]